MATTSTSSRIGTALLRIIAGIVGAGIIACVTYAALAAVGGIHTPTGPLLVALAFGLVAGSMSAGFAWHNGRKALAVALALLLVTGETYALLNTGERELEAREAKQAPVRAAMVERERLEKAVTTTPRLEAALVELTKVREGARKTIAEASCVKLCKDTLDKQEAKAEREVKDARDEATANADAVKTALAALPAVAAVSPLAARINVPDWVLDLIRAGLFSVSANGLGAFLLAFASHGGRKSVPGVQSVPSVAPVSEPRALSFESEKGDRTDAEIEELKRILNGLDREVRQVLEALASSGRPLSNDETAKVMRIGKSEASKRNGAAAADGWIKRWREGKFVYSDLTDEGRKLISLVA